MTADDVETLRLLRTGDNYGDVDSLERVVDETEDEEFDSVIHYDENYLYSEVVRTALYGTGTAQEGAEIDEVVEPATSTFGVASLSSNRDCKNFSKSGQKIINSDHCETRDGIYADSTRNCSIGISVTSS